MRCVVVLVLFEIGLNVLPARAQVIGGESTYEDNFAHTPPADVETPGKKNAASTPDATNADRHRDSADQATPD